VCDTDWIDNHQCCHQCAWERGLLGAED
jgi:hypothetical protein